MKPKLFSARIAIITFPFLLAACGGHSPSAAGNPFSSANSSDAPLIDSAKLKGDLDDILSGMASGKPDTTKMKKAGADILNTAASLLSDSGMDKLYGHDNDPAVQSAKGILEKMRNATGLTPQALDSMKQAANKLLK